MFRALLRARARCGGPAAPRHGSARLLHASPLAAAKIAVKVPVMAESITEGTIVQVARVGQAVAVDEVVAVIETDKVRMQNTAAGSQRHSRATTQLMIVAASSHGMAPASLHCPLSPGCV